MQWMMGAMKALMSKDSIQSMTWLTYGNTLNTYIGNDIPREYGGKSAPLYNTGLTPKYDNVAVETNGALTKDDKPEESDAEWTELD